MKKEYQKPKMIYESFELSQSIAAGCEFISNHSYGVCAVDVPNVGAVFITDEVGACKITPPGGYDYICYDVPAGNQNVFSS